VLFRFLTTLEHESSDIFGVDEVEINSYNQDSRPYSIHSYTCQTKSTVEQIWLGLSGDGRGPEWLCVKLGTGVTMRKLELFDGDMSQ
jgi:hypothetical protein